MMLSQGRGRIAAAIAACVAGYGGPAFAGNYTIISSTIDPSVASPLEKRDTVVQEGSNPLNRFTWHHVQRLHDDDSDSDSDSDCDSDGDSDSERHRRRKNSRGSIILLPTAFANFKQQMLGDPGKSVAEVLAKAGYEVHGYSPRTSHVPPGGCSSGAVDCSVMVTWGYQTYLDDINYIRRQVDEDSDCKGKCRKPVIGGLSTGAALAMAAVNERPQAYSGLFFHDMMVISTDAFVVNQAAGNCALYTDFINAGFAFDEDTPAFIKFVASDEPTFTSVFGVPFPEFGGTPTFQFFASNSGATALTIGDWPTAQENALSFNDVESLPLLRDEQCMWAGDRTFTGNLNHFRKPILAIKEGLAYGNFMQESLDLTRSRDVTVISHPTFGHLDTLTHPDQKAKYHDPLLDWLDSVF